MDFACLPITGGPAGGHVEADSRLELRHDREAGGVQRGHDVDARPASTAAVPAAWEATSHPRQAGGGGYHPDRSSNLSDSGS